MDMTAAPDSIVVRKIMMPEDHTVGEALFVPRDSAALRARQCSEDDGYLIAYGANIKTGDSYCVVCLEALLSGEQAVTKQMQHRTEGLARDLCDWALICQARL